MRLSQAMFSVAVAAFEVGCSPVARDPDQYRDDTVALLESQHEALTVCYDSALLDQPRTEGIVTVHFTVGKKSGRIKDVNVDSARTTAPRPLVDCVVKYVDGLFLAPGDAHDGQATFVWEFTREQSASAGGPS